MGEIRPNVDEVLLASGDQTTRLGLAMTLAGLRDYMLNVEFPASTFVKRARRGGEIGTKRAKLADMGQQLVADLVLIGLRQPLRGSDGIFECFRHGETLAAFRRGVTVDQPPRRPAVPPHRGR